MLEQTTEHVIIMDVFVLCAGVAAWWAHLVHGRMSLSTHGFVRAVRRRCGMVGTSWWRMSPLSVATLASFLTRELLCCVSHAESDVR